MGEEGQHLQRRAVGRIEHKDGVTALIAHVQPVLGAGEALGQSEQQLPARRALGEGRLQEALKRAVEREDLQPLMVCVGDPSNRASCFLRAFITRSRMVLDDSPLLESASFS